MDAPYDSIVNPTGFFIAAIERAGQVALADLQTVGTVLPDSVRDRCLHVLGFALSLPSIWPLTRELLLALSPWLELQGLRGNWTAFLETGVAQAQQQDDKGATARLYLHLGRLRLLQDDHQCATRYLRQAAELAEAIGDTVTWACALHRLAWSAVQRSLLPEAEQLAQHALALLPADDPHSDQCYTVLGRVALYRRNWEKAIEHFRSSLAVRERLGGPANIAPGLRDLGIAFMMSGRYAEAVTTMHSAIEMFNQIGALYEKAVVGVNLGITYWYQGDYQAALTCYAESEPVFTRLGVAGSLGKLYNNRGLAYRELCCFDEAEAAFVRALELMRSVGAVIEMVNTLENLAELYVRLDQRERAITYLYDALRQLEQLPEKPLALHQTIVNHLRDLDG